MSDVTRAFRSLDRTVPVRLDPTVVPVERGPDEVQIRAGPWAGPILTLRDDGGDGTLVSVVEELDSGASVSDVAAAVEGASESDVRDVLAELDRKNLVRRGRGTSATDRSPRPLRFAADDLDALATKSVLVVSSGPIGRTVTGMLSQAGVGEVLLRQRRVAGTGESVQGTDDVATWDEVADLARLVDDVDLVVTATRQPWRAATTRVNELAVGSGTPLARAAVVGYDVVVGPTVLPGETACYECFRHHRNATVPEADAYRSYETAAVGREGGVADRLPFSAVAAGLLVTDVVDVLCYGHGFTVGSVLTFDMATLSMEANDVLRVPRCDACGEVDGPIGRDALFTVEDLVKR